MDTDVPAIIKAGFGNNCALGCRRALEQLHGNHVVYARRKPYDFAVFLDETDKRGKCQL